MKIDLGCGNVKRGDIGIDKMDFGQEYVLDLERKRLPFKDNLVDEFICHHFLEHLHDVKNILNECWRTLKPCGKLKNTSPYGLIDSAFNPVHFQYITKNWVEFLEREDCQNYDYKRWKIHKLELIHNNQEIYFEISPFK